LERMENHFVTYLWACYDLLMENVKKQAPT